MVSSAEAQRVSLETGRTDFNFKQRAGMAARGFLEHPLLAVVWLHFRLLPGANRFAQAVSKGLHQEPDSLLIPAAAIRAIFGESGLGDLKAHFAPNLDLERVRRFATPAKKSETIRKVLADFSARTPPYQARPDESLSTFLQAKSIPELPVSALVCPPSEMVPAEEEVVTWGDRIRGWQAIFLELSDPGRREKENSYVHRLNIFGIFNNLLEKFTDRKFQARNPLFLIELALIFQAAKISYIRERSTELFEPMAHTFALGLQATMMFLGRAEQRRMGSGNLTALLTAQAEESAWCLLSLAKRSPSPQISIEIQEIIAQTMDRITEGVDEGVSEVTTGVMSNIIDILRLIPNQNVRPVKLAWLKEKTGGEPFGTEELFTIEAGEDSEELVLRLAKGADIKADFQIFTWFALRFSSQKTITLQLADGQAWVIEAAKVRDYWLVHPDGPLGNPVDFYALAAADSKNKLRQIKTL